MKRSNTLRVAERIGELRGLPARVVWGAADRFQKLHYGERFAKDLGCPIDRIQGGKHFVPEDHPGRVADAIIQVLREVRTERAVGEPAHA